MNYLGIFGNRKQNQLKFNHKEEIYQLFAILYFILLSYSTQSPELTEKLHFYLPVSALSYLAGSVSGTIIPDPDPCKSSGSMRIRILNTGYKSQLKTANYLYFFILSKLGQYSRYGSKLITYIWIHNTDFEWYRCVLLRFPKLDWLLPKKCVLLIFSGKRDRQLW